MKAHLYLVIISIPFILLFSCEQPQRPGVLVNPEDKALVNSKIENHPWAKSTFDKIHDRVTPFVEKHGENPEWLLSRYMMNWQEGQHYTRFQGDAEGTALVDQDGNAPVPTVRVTTHKRPPVTDDGYRYKMPPIEDLVPYDTNKRMHLQSSGPSGERKWVDPRSMISSINGRFNDLALDAAIVYWLTDEEPYAEFAGDILMQWANGAVHQQPIEGSLRNGMFSVQTLGDRHYAPLALVYDFIYDYLNETGVNTENVEKVLTKMAETQVERGFVDNNWYAAETTTLVWSALALSDKQKQDSLMDYFISKDYIRPDNSGFGQKSIKTTVEEFFSKEGHWEEPPNYHNFPVGELMESAIAADNNGYQIFQKYPTLFKASYAISLFTFPNGKAMAFGDCHNRTGQSPELLEMALAMADKYGLEVKGQLAPMLQNMLDKGAYSRERAGFMGLFSYLPELPSKEAPLKELGRSRDLGFAQCYMQRNGNDPANGLMYYVQGASYNHNHANGMAMEIYGENYVLGADPGADVSYNTKAHAEYYKQWAAHNTVLAGGKSRSVNDYSLGTMEIGQIERMHMEPAEGDFALSPYYAYTETKYLDQSTKTRQRRVMAIVRTSATTGYYIDIFRSDNPERNDYIYHNIGHRVSLHDGAGDAIKMRPSNGLSEDFGNMGPGYAYFENKKESGGYSGNLKATFTLEKEYKSNVFMNMHVLGNPGRKYFSAQTPRTHTAPTPYDQLKTPTVVVQQNGPAWDHPFRVIFEPFNGQEKPTVKSIGKIAGFKHNAKVTGLKVRSKNIPGEKDQTDYIFHTLNKEKTYRNNRFEFEGVFGIISEQSNGGIDFYLDKGDKLMRENAGIKSTTDENISATFSIEEGGIFYSAEKEVRLHIPYKSKSEDENFKNLEVYYSKNGKGGKGENIEIFPDSLKNGHWGIIAVTLPAGYNIPLKIN